MTTGGTCAFADEARRALRAARGGRVERCGVLFGSRDGDEVRVESVVELPNRAARPDRFVLDPADVVRACREHERADRECVGTWHTHPHAPARLSAHDLAGAAPGWISVVVGEDGDLAAHRHAVDGEVTELSVAPWVAAP